MSTHPLDCECCNNLAVNRNRRRGTKRPLLDEEEPAWHEAAWHEAEGEDAEGEEAEGEEAEGEEAAQTALQEERALIHHTIFKTFDDHVAHLDLARRKRIELLSFKSALEEEGDGEVNKDASQDEMDGLGVWMPGDEFQGDVNYRTLQKLLTRVDQRGFERSSQQLEFHVAFLKAAARIIYRGSWETERPAIMRKHGWEKSNSEVLISTPRRFGKTFSIAIFCACLALSFGLEVVVFSPARRASRKLLERIVEFVRLAGGDKRICEYNQEACRVLAFDGKKSLIRSFPSKVGVCSCDSNRAASALQCVLGIRVAERWAGGRLLVAQRG